MSTSLLAAILELTFEEDLDRFRFSIPATGMKKSPTTPHIPEGPSTQPQQVDQQWYIKQEILDRLPKEAVDILGLERD